MTDDTAALKQIILDLEARNLHLASMLGQCQSIVSAMVGLAAEIAAANANKEAPAAAPKPDLKATPESLSPPTIAPHSSQA